MSHLHVVGVVTELKNMIVVKANGLPDPETGQLFEEIISEETGKPKGPHAIYIQVEAIASRMHAYGVKTPEEAIEAILKEHAVSLHRLEIKEHKAVYPHYKKLGGLSDEVEITWASGAKSARDKVLKEHADKIKSEHAARAPRETSPKEN